MLKCALRIIIKRFKYPIDTSSNKSQINEKSINIVVSFRFNLSLFQFSKENFGGILLCGDSNFWVCGWNPSVWPFKWKLLRTFAHNSSHVQIFFKLLLQLDNDQLMSERQNNWGVTMLVSEIKRIENHSVSRSFGHVKRYRLQCYQRKKK